MISETLDALCRASVQVGSRVTCNPPPTDTDDDRLCLVDDVVQFVEAAQAEGFTQGGSGHVVDEPLSFVSLKRDSDRMNLIVTTCATFYDAFVLATGLARRFNLMDKSDRIALFQAVIYGNVAERY